MCRVSKLPQGGTLYLRYLGAFVAKVDHPIAKQFELAS